MRTRSSCARRPRPSTTRRSKPRYARARRQARERAGGGRGAGGARASMPTTGSATRRARRRWPTTPLNDAATPEMRAEALLQLGLWGKVPQRDRVVGIYRPADSARWQAGRRCAGRRRCPRCWARRPKPCSSRRSKPSATCSCANAAPDAGRRRWRTTRRRRPCASARSRRSMPSAAMTCCAAIEAAEKSSAAALRLAALQIVAQPRARARAARSSSASPPAGSEAEQQAAFQAMGAAQAPQTRAKLLVGALDQLAAGKVQPGAQVELIEAVEKSDGAGGEGALGEAAGRLGRERRSRSRRIRSRSRAAIRWRGAQRVLREPGAALRALPQGGRRRRRGGPGPVAHRRAEAAEYLLEAIVKPSAHIAAGLRHGDVHAQRTATPRPASVVERDRPTEIVLKRGDGTHGDARSEAGESSAWPRRRRCPRSTARCCRARSCATWSRSCSVLDGAPQASDSRRAVRRRATARCSRPRRKAHAGGHP